MLCTGLIAAEAAAAAAVARDLNQKNRPQGPILIHWTESWACLHHLLWTRSVCSKQLSVTSDVFKIYAYMYFTLIHRGGPKKSRKSNSAHWGPLWKIVPKHPPDGLIGHTTILHFILQCRNSSGELWCYCLICYRGEGVTIYYSSQPLFIYITIKLVLLH